MRSKRESLGPVQVELIPSTAEHCPPWNGTKCLLLTSIVSSRLRHARQPSFRHMLEDVRRLSPLTRVPSRQYPQSSFLSDLILLGRSPLYFRVSVVFLSNMSCFRLPPFQILARELEGQSLLAVQGARRQQGIRVVFCPRMLGDRCFPSEEELWDRSGWY